MPATRVERIGDATLYLGDCRDILPEIGRAAVVVTDPPYGIGYVTNHRKVLATPPAITNDGAPPLWAAPLIADCVMDGGAIYLCTRFDVMPEWQAAMAGAGVTLKTPIVWDKGNWTAGDLEGDYGNQVEIVLFAHVGRHKLRGGRPANLWSIPRPPPGGHPTPKPVGLMAGCIENSTDRTGLVVDPFMGGGATGEAAARLGRPFVGIEIELEYFDLARRRLEAAARQADMFAM